jgi:prevent-host-death family protein
MTTTLSQTQAELPRLVELASHGEDVVITVDGKPKARLTKANQPLPEAKKLTPAEVRTWDMELRELRERFATGKMTPTSEQIIDEDRADR